MQFVPVNYSKVFYFMAEGDCENYICKCHNKNVEKKYLKNDEKI